MPSLRDLEARLPAGSPHAAELAEPVPAVARGASGPALRGPAAWATPPVLAAFAVAIGIVALHAATAASIVAIWIRSETFAHGFLVVPICVWLVWREREGLADVAARPWWPGLLFVAGAGAMWLVTSAAGVLGLKQFALAFMVQAAIVTVVGTRVARAIAFPLLFLLFAIPVGEMFVPTLIEWTADFTVSALRFSGVPVYREANHFVIPSGQWSVVEACSGIRYIIASVMVGTIYAAVAYRSVRKRAWFMAAAIVVPIVANWLRAYMIVMLGHLSDNKIAVGVDHVIYGWVFFGVVMVLLFWVGSFWQEAPPAARAVDGADRTAPGTSIRTAARAGATKLAAAVAACLVAAGIWLPLEAAVERPSSAVPGVAAWPAQGGWVATDRKIADWTPHYRGFAWDANRTYAKDGREVGVYVAYFRNQTKGNELVTSGNQLTTMESASWKSLTHTDETVEWDGASVAVRRTEIGGLTQRLDAVRLFWVDGHVTGSEYVAKARTAWAKLWGRGDDSALVVIYAQRGASEAQTLDTLRAFARDMSPAIAGALASVRAAAP